jgi:hypothetical protein
MVGMDPRTRRLGWGWWAQAWLLLVAGVYLGYRIVPRRQSREATKSGAFCTRATFERIQLGMDEKAVRAILGHKPQLEDPDFSTYTWADADNMIEVQFDCRGVAEVSWSDIHRPQLLLYKSRSWLRDGLGR